MVKQNDPAATAAEKNPETATPATDNANAPLAPKKDDTGAGTANAAIAAGENKVSPDKSKQTPPLPPVEKPAIRVRVICEGTLGPKLLEKGDITSDEDYVAILQQRGQKKVERV